MSLVTCHFPNEFLRVNNFSQIFLEISLTAFAEPAFMATRISNPMISRALSHSRSRRVPLVFSTFPRLAVALCVGGAFLISTFESAHAYEWQNSAIWDNDSAFTSGPAWFSAGPAWMMHSLPGSHFRARPLYVLDNSGDTQQSTNEAPYVGTLHDVFNVNLFSNVSGFVGGGGSSKTLTPMVTDVTTATFVPTSGTQSWNVGANWSSNPIFPNGIDDSATFINAPTAAEQVNLNIAITVGSITLNTSNSVFTLANGTAGSLTFDTTSGNASMTLGGSGTATNVLSASVTLNKTTQFNINDNAGGLGTTGALNVTGTMGGAGGIIKSGAGLMTFQNNAKTYTGSTQIDQGVLRVLTDGQMTGTSSITVNSGGQLNLGSGGAAGYSFGSSGGALITLNGPGAGGTGSLPGALRSDGSGATTLANNVSIATDSTIYVSSGTGSLSLNGTLSGSGQMTKSGNGTLILNHSNTSFTGATVIAAGTLNAGAANALGGTSGITINNGGTLLLSNNTTTDRINNSASATITLKGGGTFNTGGLSEGTAPVPATSTNGVVGMGALTLSTTSSGSHAIIDFGSGANGSTLVFDSLTGASGAFLDIKNWTNTPLVDAGLPTSDRLLFATQPAFTDAQLAHVAFYNDAGTLLFTGGTIIPYGNEFELVAAPEPSTWIGAALALGAIGVTQRKRFAKRSRVTG
jgi:autotransporter-associated beta strand protein